jgi:predicted nuclease of predicted toxin-antitoxin system
VSLSLLLDEDVSPRVAVGLRRRGVDAVSVHELGRANAAVTDEAQLEAAASAGRVLVTYNRADFQALDAEWRLQGKSHAGILWCSERTVPRRAIGDLVRHIAAFAQARHSLRDLCLPLTRTDD